MANAIRKRARERAIEAAEHLENWAGVDWPFCDAGPLLLLAEEASKLLALAFTPIRSAQSIEHFQREVDAAIRRIRAANNAFPIVWEESENGGRRSKSRGQLCSLSDDGSQSASFGIDPTDQTFIKFEPALKDAIALSKMLLVWAAEDQENDLPNPETVNDLEDESISIWFDDLLRDDWSRRYALECDRRLRARILILNMGGEAEAVDAIRRRTRAAHKLLRCTPNIDEAIAYVRGNGGPADRTPARNSKIDPKPLKKRGRPKGTGDTDRNRDKKVFEMWDGGFGRFKTKEELARRLELSVESVKQIIDRERKRRKS